MIPSAHPFPALLSLPRFLHLKKFSTICGLLLLVGVMHPARAKNETLFLDFLQQPNVLQEIIQPGSVSWQELAPGKDILLKQELAYARKKQDAANVTRLAVSLGFFELKHYRNNQALDYFLEAYSAARKNNDPAAVINAGLSVAFVQKSIGAYQRANEVLSALRPSLDQLRNPQTNGIVYALMGDNYGWLNEIASCTEAYRRATRYFRQAKLQADAAFCFIALGENQLRMDAYTEATASFRTALFPAATVATRALIFRDLGLVDFKQRRFENAVEAFQKSDALLADHIVKKLLKECYMQLFTLYSYENDFAKADAYHDRYRRTKAELEASGLPLIASERARVIRMLQYKREQRDSTDIAGQQLELSRMIDKRDLELQRKEKELAIKTSEADSLSVVNAKHELDITRKEAQISRYQNARNLLVSVALIAILLVILFYNRYKLKKKSGEALARKNEELVLTLSQLRSAQDQLIHSEKMAGLGKLTAGIAHEIQNPLNFVRNFSESGIELLEEFSNATSEEEKAELYKELQETLGRIRHHAGRADGIVKSMLQHSRAGSSTLEKTDLNALLSDSVQLSFHSMRATLSNFQCRIEESFETLPEAEVLPQQISRVVLNLSNNAFYAMFEEGNKNEQRKDAVLKVSSFLSGDKIHLVFEDNGPGIPPQNLQRIFEPFYTTKPSGKGTGLGLSISYDIIRQHGGDLLAESSPGQGAKFTIILPVKAEMAGS